jgi:hypothetical protein
MGPENREGEHQLAHDVKVLRSGDMRVALALQPGADDAYRHWIQRGTREEITPVVENQI